MMIKQLAYSIGLSLMVSLGIYAYWQESNQWNRLDLNPKLNSIIYPELPGESVEVKQVCEKKNIAQAKALPTPVQSTPSSSPKTKKYNHKEYIIGFQSTQTQDTPIQLDIHGKIPEWVYGTYLAIGPGQFQAKGKSADYWFDGFGMIHQFILNGKGVTYKNNLISSEYYKRTCDSGIFGSKPTEKKSTWAKLKGAVSSQNDRPKYDNANINLIQMNDTLIACTETPHAWCIDPHTILQTHPCAHDDSLEGHFSTAHPLYDAHTKEWFNVMIHFSHNSTYTIYSMKAGSFERIPLITLPAPYPSYIHSFAITQDYILLIEVPFTVSPYDLLLSETGFIDNFTWKPKNGTRISIISRATKQLIGTYKTDAFFALHHLNAYQEGENIILESAIYQDPKIIKSFFLGPIAADEKHTFEQAHLVRFTINIPAKKISKKELSPSSIEFPQINKEYALKAHRFVYGITSKNNRVTSDGIIKIDTKKGTELVWREDSCFPCEPLFVAAPCSKSEDDGVILSLVLDGCKKKSFLLILNALDLKEMGRAYVPYPIAYTVHSLFIKEKSPIQNSQSRPHKKHHLFPPFRQKQRDGTH